MRKKIRTKGGLKKQESKTFHDYCTYLDNMDFNRYSKDEEHDIITKIREGNDKLREMFIRNNLPLVITVSKNYQQPNEDFMDIIQQGNIGLIKALEKYNLAKGGKFSTYAVWWIRQSILQYLNEYNRILKLPQLVVDNIKKLRKLQDEYGYYISDEFIKEKLGISDNRLKQVIDYSFMYQTTTDYYDDIDTDYNKAKDLLSEYLLSQLPYRTSSIIRMRMGYNGKEMSIIEIGNVLNLSRNRVHKLFKDGLQHLIELTLTDKTVNELTNQ